MEEMLGMEQIKIGQRVADFNLKKETMGKVAILCDGKAKFPVSVFHDMGWQKLVKTYDSLSGQGLMISDRTKHVVCYQNYSKSCGVCERHAKTMKTTRHPTYQLNSTTAPKTMMEAPKEWRQKQPWSVFSKFGRTVRCQLLSTSFA
jgi:hypothetical protein